MIALANRKSSGVSYPQPEPTSRVKKAGQGDLDMPTTQPKAKDQHDEVICEPGKHVNCLHAKMAAKRAAAKGT